MRLIKIVILVFLFFQNFYSICYGMENVFYILRGNEPDEITTNQEAFSSLEKHFKLINILISQAYQVDQNGNVWGFVDPDVLNFTKIHSMKLMVLITNEGFDTKKVSKFLANPDAQKKAIDAILAACNQHHYYGVQFDFEMVALKEKNVLTKFFQQAARALHQQGFKVSFALAPVIGDKVFPSDFQRKIYENWEAAYDFKALGESSDFVTIMAYSQHGNGTTPGPTASFPWTVAIIKHALKYIPAQKISLGLSTDSTYWFTADTKPGNTSGKFAMQMSGLSYTKADYLLHKHRASLQWDEIDRVNYAIFNYNWLKQYLFLENARSLAEKIKLVEKYKLRGISVFNIGTEDPKIWDVLAGLSHLK